MLGESEGVLWKGFANPCRFNFAVLNPVKYDCLTYYPQTNDILNNIWLEVIEMEWLSHKLFVDWLIMVRIYYETVQLIKIHVEGCNLEVQYGILNFWIHESSCL